MLRLITAGLAVFKLEMHGFFQRSCLANCKLVDSRGRKGRKTKKISWGISVEVFFFFDERTVETFESGFKKDEFGA